MGQKPARLRFRDSSIFRPIAISAAVLLPGFGMTYYYGGVLIPLRQMQYTLAHVEGGNYSDLYPRWVGARELLLHGRNPYSPQITQEIQRGFYGRAINRSNPTDPTDDQAFAYPVYITFLIAPALPFRFEHVRVVFRVLLMLITALSFVLWMRVLSWPIRSWKALLAWVVMMSSFPVVDGLHAEQITLLVAALIAAALAALGTGWMFLAGILLACSTVKPQLAFLITTFLFIWTLGKWDRRKWFAIGFGGVLTLLLAGSELLLPGWFRLWIQAAHAYAEAHKPSLLMNIVGRGATPYAGAVVIFLCVALFWHFRKEDPGSPRFTFAMVTALAATPVFWPNHGSVFYNQVILTPAVIWMFTLGRVLARISRVARVMWCIALTLLGLSYLLAFAVTAVSLALPRYLNREATVFVAGPEFLLYVFPLTIALFVLSVAPRLWARGGGGTLHSAEFEGGGT